MAGTPTRARPARRRRWPRRVLWALLVVIVVVVGYGAGLYFWADGRLRTTQALGDYEGRPAAGRGSDWLLVGSDSRAGLTPEQRKELHVGGDAGLNTDTIMVLHYGDNGPYLVSIPRDSYVQIPGHGRNKINAAYALGGPRLLTRTVEQATGLRIGHYVEVGFLGLVDVVDSLDGVTLCVPPGGLHDERSGADFDAGCQRMDGVQALRYVRARYSDPRGDLGRAERQRELVHAVADEALSASVLVPPWRVIPFLSATLDALVTDRRTGLTELTRMGRELSDPAATTTVPVASEPEIPGVGDVVVWDRAGAARLFDALRDDRAIPTFGGN